MSHPKDIDEHTPSEAELMLVDLLYGELDEDEEARAQERVEDSGLGDELSQLRELRGLFRELPDEEPPASATAKLMHAAAVNGPKARGEEAGSAGNKGLLAWLLSMIRPIAMYPGLAAATSVVLVVGLAGALYLSGRDQLATVEKLPAPAEAPAGQGAAAAPPAPAMTDEEDSAEPPADMAEMAEKREAVEGGEAEAADDQLAAVPQQARAERQAEKKARKADAPRKRRLKKKARSSKRKPSSTRGGSDVGGVLGGAWGKGRSAGYYDGDLESSNAQPGSASGSINLSDKSAAGAGGSRRRKAPTRDQAPAAEPAPAPSTRQRRSMPAEEAPAQRRSDSSKDEDDAAAESKEAAVRARVRSLHEEARSAARQEDCKTVTEIARSIAKLDPDYYRRVFYKDKLVAQCRNRK